MAGLLTSSAGAPTRRTAGPSGPTGLFAFSTLVLTVLSLLFLLLSAPASRAMSQDPDGTEITERWTGGILSATYEAGVCVKRNGDLRGVLLLTHRTGDTDVYHFYGKVEDGRIRASHGSGHTFRGEFADNETVTGVIRLKNGLRLNLEGRRHHNAQVTDDCAPLK